MKAITLHQPWASLVAAGVKHIETRSWRTKYRGPLAIHAAQTHYVGPWSPELARATSDLCNGLQRYPEALPRAAVVAIAQLDACALIEPAAVEGRLSNLEIALGDFTPGRYAWILLEVEALPEPIPAKGHRQLWNWER